MTLEIKHPSGIYQRINEELDKIIHSFQSQSNEYSLNEAQNEALGQLGQHQTKLCEQLAKLEKNAEWNTFTIAFYGETGAGKSSIIETLRILLREPSKLASQKEFRELQDKYDLSEESLQNLAHGFEQASLKLTELTQKINMAQQEKAEFSGAQHDQERLYTADSVIPLLLSQQAEAEQRKLDLAQQQIERESHLGELDVLADGSIIGDGRSDFTRKTQRYDFELNGQNFTLLDVPGIEGKEGLVLDEIEQAVQSAHAVFYVTNQAAPPQTGDEKRKGTLEKIKTHLAAQTEVWTLFNKKIVNPLAIKDQPLIKGDEQGSLDVLDEKMREHLGNNYREVLPLSALPAFLISTDHFAPNSRNAKRRRKLLNSFGEDELLEKTRMQALIRMLSEQLLSNSEAKIKAANFNHAKGRIDESSEKIQHIQQTFVELAEKLELDGNSSCKQLRQSFNALKQRLESRNARLIDELISGVRRPVYQQIEKDISNDAFKKELHRHIEKKQKQFNKKLHKAIREEVEIFQKDAQDIFNRFEEYSQELIITYGKLGSTKINGSLDIKIKIDNGINMWGLLSGVVGLVLAPLTSGASLWLVGAALLTSLVSVGKAIWGAFSTSYKQSQQRKATEDNLRRIKNNLQNGVRTALDEALPDIQKVIDQLEKALTAPAQQATEKAQLLKHSTQKLNLLSRQISNLGNL